MSSVAYPAQPTRPGWWATAWLMFLGWLGAALALGGLYLAGMLLGAIGRNEYAFGSPGVHAINDWPFAHNGTWSLLADISVFVLALGVTTVVMAWQLRAGFPVVSEDRLLIVLLFTGGVPYLTSEKSAPLFFLIAVWAVRGWVVRDDFRFPRRALAVVAAILLLAIGSYGLLHPVWVQSATTISAMPRAKRPLVLLMLHNASRTTLDIDGFAAGGYTLTGHGWPSERRTQPPFRVGAGRTETLTLTRNVGTCGNGLIATLRYRELGLTLHQPVRLAVPGLAGCS